MFNKLIYLTINDEILFATSSGWSIRKVRKKKEISSGHSSVWLPKDVHRKAKLLALWMEAEGIPRPGSIGELLAEAFDTLIDIKYPKAKKYVEIK